MYQIKAYGDRGLRIQFGQTITPETNQSIRSFSMMLEKENIPGVVEWIPTYTALTILYDPYYISYITLERRIVSMLDRLEQLKLPPATVIEIPTCYGGEYGPDLAEVAKHTGLDKDKVISIHYSRTYLIYMLGFIPGFPYLGGMSKEIAAPRLANPRLKISAGSVGIAGEQTGIYPLESPGGWQLIGRTPIKLYDPDSDSPVLLKAGNYIRFRPISGTEYEEIEQKVKQGNYKPRFEDYSETNYTYERDNG